MRLERTAKSCGSGAAVLALSSGEATLLAGDGGKRAVLREEHEVSRKAIAQGRPECFLLPCMLVCPFVLRKSHARPRVQQAPGLPCALYFEEGRTKMQTSGAMRREKAKLYPRHCEERSDEAIHLSLGRGVDCFAALAMTGVAASTY